MTTKVSEEPQPGLEEAHITRKRGGWITFPFLTVSLLGLGLSLTGAMSNIIVYLIKEYNMKSIDAAQTANIISGCTSLTPVVGAIISDAYFGCYPVVAFSTIPSLLSVILFTLTAALPSLRPSPCTPGSDDCTPPSAGQLALLYTAVGLLAVGTGGTRFNTMTLGAAQFDKARDQVIFFNWYFVILYLAAVLGSTAIVYVEDSISWALGFGLCIIANAISAIFLLLGSRYYHRVGVQGSPFASLARVVVAAIKKRKIVASADAESLDYYCGSDVVAMPSAVLTPSFSFLNRAAVICPGDTDPDGSVAKPWRLCSVQEVRDLKAVLRLVPIWSSGVLVSVSIGMQGSLTVLQALTMDRSLGPHFAIPAGSMGVVSLASTALFLTLYDRLLLPLARGRSPTHLQRLGLGHLLNVAAMAASALVERRRAGVVHAHYHADQGQASSPPAGWMVPMSALWLVVPLAIVGAGEAMHFPAQVALYYQEFPESLRSTATGMVALIIALGFYLSTAVVDLVRRATGWLPDNINASRLENVYWLVTVLVAINFAYYLLCARLHN